MVKKFCRRALVCACLVTWAGGATAGANTGHDSSQPPASASGAVASISPTGASHNPPQLSPRNSAIFPMPPLLVNRVNFWKKVYSVYTTRQAIIHDSEHLNVIYEVVDLDTKFRKRNASSRTVRRWLKKRKRRIANILNRLHKHKGQPRTAEERAIAGKLASLTGRSKYRVASRRIRVQIGQADRFRKSLKRSGRYLGRMKSIFKSYGLPAQLTALPHVESSFNYNAYSSAGAAGIWQFTRSTGRLFMKINYTVDERRDPITSTHAAARLLKLNYNQLHSWPLAITAYNHGLNGMRKAQRRYGNNIAKVIAKYRSRSFGFASKNFYAEFLAALDVASHYRAHFGRVVFYPEYRFDELKVPFYTSARTLARHMGISTKKLRSYNLALRNSVWKGYRRIPRGFTLRVPRGMGATAKLAFTKIPGKYKFTAQRNNGFHIVRRGDTLSTIARRYRSSVVAFKSVNSLRSSLIRPGQKLRIPGGKARRSRPVASPTGKAPAANPGWHVVRRGESLYSIASLYRIKVASLARLNQIPMRATIYPGQKLDVSAPAPSAPSVKNAVYVKPASPPAPVAYIKPDSQEPVVQGDGESITVNGKVLKVKVDDFTVNVASRGVGKLTVRPEETMGHYAEWAKVSLRKIKRLNRRVHSRRMKIGGHARVPLTRVNAEEFERKRIEYHMQLFEDFFEAYSVDEEKKVNVRKGQSLWDLCVNENNAPIWLVQLYNPGIMLDDLKPGDPISIPTIVKKTVTSQ